MFFLSHDSPTWILWSFLGKKHLLNTGNYLHKNGITIKPPFLYSEVSSEVVNSFGVRLKRKSPEFPCWNFAIVDASTETSMEKHSECEFSVYIYTSNRFTTEVQFQYDSSLQVWPWNNFTLNDEKCETSKRAPKDFSSPRSVGKSFEISWEKLQYFTKISLKSKEFRYIPLLQAPP